MKKVVLAVTIVAVVLVGVYIAEKSRAAKASNASAPQPGPENIQDIRNKPLDLTPYKGKVVLVNFWATWCQPCRIEIPWMIEFQQQYADKGFVVLGVSTDDSFDDLRPFVRDERFDVAGEKRAMNYPIFLGDDTAAQTFGGILGMPTSILIAKDGTVVKKIIGLVNHDYLKAEIEKLL